MSEPILWLCLVLGGVSAGESSLLLVGMHSDEKPVAWMTPANLAYSVSDIALGIGLGATALALGDDKRGLLIPLGLLTITNGMRMVEYLSHSEAAFCANEALFVVDVAKLITGLIAIGLVITDSMQNARYMGW